MSLPAAAPFADVARAMTADRAAPHGLRLTIEELTLAVRSNSAAVIDDLRGYFSGFVSQAGGDAPADLDFLFLDGPAAEPPVDLAPRQTQPGKRPDKERFADVPGGLSTGRMVRKQATGMLFLFGQGVNLAVGPCAQNRNQLVNFLCARYMERRVASGWILGHASGVAGKGPAGAKALALCGFSGMGKSTLALHLVARGCDFLSNDRVLVESNPETGPVLHGIPKHPRLNPGTALGNPELAPLLSCALPAALRRACEHLAPEALRAVEDKYDARIDVCFGPSRFRLAAPLAGLAVLNWKHGGGPLTARRVDLAERRDLLEALRKEPGAFYLPDALRTARLSAEECLEALAGVPALELCGGSDFPAAATACLELLG